MHTIASAVTQLIEDNVPVLLIDTCAILDIIRAPLRPIPHCIQSAIELAEMQSKGLCRIVASSMIEKEWSANETAVLDALGRHLETCDQDAVAIHEACELVDVTLSFGRPAYKDTGLVAKLRDLAASLRHNAVHISVTTDEIKSKATSRVLLREPPARKGGGIQDCIIVEEYLELCRHLHVEGFTKKRTFCSSNTKDYQDGRLLHKSLKAEFDSVGLVFTNKLNWAVNELKKP